MNTIKAILDKSDFEVYNNYYLNYKIDGFWLDEKLDFLLPNNLFKGTVPTLLSWLENMEERKVVWERILPKKGSKSICPILMCPDDADFSCTLINAEIENTGAIIKWNKIGLDQTKTFDPKAIGTNVKWFKNSPHFKFNLEEYKVMLSDFKKQLV